MARLKTALGWVADISIRTTRQALIVIASFLLFAIYGITQIVIDDGSQSVFSSERSEYANYLALEQNFSTNSNNVAILFSSQNEIEAQDLATLYDFIIESQFLDDVEAVYSLFSLTRIDPESGRVVALVPTNLDASVDIKSLLSTIQNSSASAVSVLSNDLRETVVILSLRDSISDLSLAAPVLAEIRGLGRTFEEVGRFEIAVTGLLPIREFVIGGIQTDQVLLNAAGAILGFLISLLIFRSFWIALFNGIAPLIALILSLGVFGIAGLSINVLTNALPVLILVLASSDCIHLTFEFRHESSLHGDIPKAIRNTVIKIGPPCVLTSVTTMLAFASLLYSESPIIKSLAVSGIIGTGIALLSVLIVHPLIFSLAAKFPEMRSALAKLGSGKARNLEWGSLFSWVLKNRTPVTLGASGLLVLAAFVFLPIQTKYRFFEFIDTRENIVQELNVIERISGPIMSIDLPLRVVDGADIFSREVLDDVRLVHEELEKTDESRVVISIHTLVRFMKSDNQVFTIKKLKDTIKLLPAHYKNRMIARNGRALLVSIPVLDSGSNEIRVLADHVEAAARQTDVSTLEIGNVTGFLVLSSRASDSMIKQLSISFLIAAVFSPLLIGLWFRRIDFALAALIPNILPIAVVGAGLTLLDWDIQFSSALALSIAFGIALDDSIHVFNRLALQKGKERGALTRPSITKAMNHVSPALFTTTAVLSGGMAATLLSDMPTVRLFGSLCIIVFVIALITDLVLLPAVVACLNENFSRSNK